MLRPGHRAQGEVEKTGVGSAQHTACRLWTSAPKIRWGQCTCTCISLSSHVGLFAHPAQHRHPLNSSSLCSAQKLGSEESPGQIPNAINEVAGVNLFSECLLK
jgi:hypothetical protein